MEETNKKESYSTIATEIYTDCVTLSPIKYKDKDVNQMKKEILKIEKSICNIPLKIVKKMVELAEKKVREEQCVFSLDLVLDRYRCAEYLVRNNMESFDELWDNPDDVVI